MIGEFKQEFDPGLREYLKGKIEESQAIVQDEYIQSQLVRLEELVMSGGKRVRPYLIDVMYRSAGGVGPCPQPYLIGIELFHLFCLIHDDVMDQGTSRHGVPTFHVQESAALVASHRHGDANRIGESQAILAGDLVYAWANSCFMSSGGSSQEVREIISAMATEVILGQMIDVDTTTRPAVSDALIEQKLNLKTARYTFVGPMKIGRALATKDNRLDTFCENFGTSIGLAFQIQDDLFDITAMGIDSSKSVLTDLRQRQHTLFTNYIYNSGTSQEIDTLNRYFGQPCNDADQAHIRALFEDSGALAYGEARMTEFFDRAQNALDVAQLESIYRSEWQELLTYIRMRQH